MTRRRLPKYITADPGPDGVERFYLRRPGQKKVRISGVPWTPSFMSQYSAALGGPNVVALLSQPLRPKATGTFNWLCRLYYESSEFRQLDPNGTQRPRKRLFDRIAREPTKPNSKLLFGDVPISAWNRKACRALRDRFVDVPSSANDMLKALRVLFGWAVEAEHMDSNPARDVKLLRPAGGGEGYHSWTIEEVEKYEQAHAIKTQARLALGLLLYSSQRQSDVIRFGAKYIKLRTHVDEETGETFERKWIVFTQHKNRNRKPVHLEIPLRPELEELIDATPGAWERETFLTQTRGKPHTRMSFTKDFADYCIAAGVPGRSHGLRKAAATRLADNGATDKEIMAITGHSTLQEVSRYTKAANQKRLAAQATAKMAGKK